MKKILSIIVSILVLLATFSFASCSSGNKTYTVATPDGAPTMAVAGLMKYNAQKYTSNVISGADVSATLTKGEVDFVVAPTNAGMKLAMTNKKYKIIATTSWGNLYLVGTSNVKTLSECATANEFLTQLEGASVSSIGTNQVPDKSFKHLLGLSSVTCTLNASEDATVIMAGLKRGDVTYGLLGEPAVTGALNNVTGLKRLASISELWTMLVGTDFPQASVFAKSRLTNDEIESFLYDLFGSINYLNESEYNALELGNYMENRGDSILKGALVKASYLKMNQKFVRATECKQDIINFINVLGVGYVEDTHSDVFIETRNINL